MRAIVPSPAVALQQAKRRLETPASTPQPVETPKPLEELYHEITAPSAEMSQLIIDARPGHEHPLLEAEARKHRLTALLRRGAEQVLSDPLPPATSGLVTPPPLPSRRASGTQTRNQRPPHTTPSRRPPPHASGPLRPRRATQPHPPRRTHDPDTAVERTEAFIPAYARPAPRRGIHTNPRTQAQSAKRIGSSLERMLRSGYVISRGYRGREVSELHALLRRQGLWGAPGQSFDVRTEAAVRTAQRRFGFEPTGVVELSLCLALRSRKIA